VLSPHTGREHLGDETVTYEQEGLVQFVIDSVFAMAHAVHNMLFGNCPPGATKPCHQIRAHDGPEVLANIRNVSFTGERWFMSIIK
jgi:hypothetical protein